MKVVTKSNSRKAKSIKEFLYILPCIIIVLIFAYYPLYGWVYAFFDYQPPIPLSESPFVGFKWFYSLVADQVKVNEILKVIRNTFAMSGLSIAFSWLPMVFAVFLNELRCRPFQKFVQTVTTLPNFISWVLVYAIAFCMFNSTGMANSVLTDMGAITKPIMFLQESNPGKVWWEMWLWLTWKNLGWAAIMYLAALAGIDQELYEAARVDGATRMQQIWYITFPCLLPTFFVLLMLSIASFLSNGMEQYFVFQNAFNRDSIQVLDLYVFNIAMNSGAYSVSAVLSMLKTLISVVLLVFANWLSKTVRGESFI